MPASKLRIHPLNIQRTTKPNPYNTFNLPPLTKQCLPLNVKSSSFSITHEQNISHMLSITPSEFTSPSTDLHFNDCKSYLKGILRKPESSVDAPHKDAYGNSINYSTKKLKVSFKLVHKEIKPLLATPLPAKKQPCGCCIV